MRPTSRGSGFKSITTLSTGDYFGEESLVSKKRLHSMYSNKGIEVLAINPQVLVEQEGEHSPKILLETLSQLSAFLVSAQRDSWL